MHYEKQKQSSKLYIVCDGSNEMCQWFSRKSFERSVTFIACRKLLLISFEFVNQYVFIHLTFYQKYILYIAEMVWRLVICDNIENRAVLKI